MQCRRDSGGSATCDLDVDGGGDAQRPPSEGAPASGPSDPESCACRVGRGNTGRAHEVWASVLALGWIGWFWRRRSADSYGSDASNDEVAVDEVIGHVGHRAG